jgi:hypothetical protein
MDPAVTPDPQQQPPLDPQQPQVVQPDQPAFIPPQPQTFEPAAPVVPTEQPTTIPVEQPAPQPPAETFVPAAAAQPEAFAPATPAEPVPPQPQTFEPAAPVTPAEQPMQPQPAVADPMIPVALPQQPPVAPVAGAPLGQPAAGKSANKMLIIGGIVVGVILLLVAGFFAMKFMGNKKDNKAPASSVVAPSSKEKTVTAESLSDYDAVCDGVGNTSVSNATAYQGGAKPHVIEVFKQDVTNRYVSTSVGLPKGSEGDSKAPTTVQIVGCVGVKTATLTGEKCTYKTSGDQTIEVPMYTVAYQLQLYEAKTGKKIGTLTDIPDSGSRCPIVAAYSKTDPKVYSSPKTDAIKAAVASYVAGS